MLPTDRSGQIGGYVDPNRPTQGGDFVNQEPAPLPGAIARTVGTRVARRMLQTLMDLRVPVSVEYVCSDVLLSVPFTYATVLDKARESAERDLQAGLFAPCQPVKP